VEARLGGLAFSWLHWSREVLRRCLPTVLLLTQGLLELLTLQLAICPVRIVCARIVGTLFWQNAVLLHESNDSRKITDCEVGPR
jgi:hypothetical protein